MSVKALKLLAFRWFPAVFVCVIGLALAFTGPLARAFGRNSLMLTWLHLMPRSTGESNLFLTSDLNGYPPSRFLALARQLEALCELAYSEEGEPCLRADIAHALVDVSRDEILVRLDRYEQGSTPQLMLATFAGDTAYIQGDRDTAVEIWKRYLSPNLLVFRAGAATERGDWGVASALLGSLEQGYVPGSRQQQAYLAAVLVKLARSSAAEAEFADAESYWRWASFVLPEQAVYYYGLGHTLVRQERWQEAAAAFRNAIALDSSKAQYFAGLAQALVQTGQTEEAIYAARRALDLDPNNKTAGRLLQRIIKEE
jgi:tetratricopeptide (TPR) repeat protein